MHFIAVEHHTLGYIAGIMSGVINWLLTFHVSYSVCATGRRVIYQNLGQTEVLFLVVVNDIHINTWFSQHPRDRPFA
jgi:hypothetical protein